MAEYYVRMLYPEKRLISENKVRMMLFDAIANDECSNEFGEPESLDVVTLPIEYVMVLLNDIGRVTLVTERGV